MFNQSQYARIYCSAWLNNGIQSSSLCRRLKLILRALSRNAKRESTQLSQSTVHLCGGGKKAICSSLHMNANQSRTTNGNATCEIHRPVWMLAQFCSVSVRLSCDTDLDGQRQPMQCQCVTVFRKGKGEKKLAGSRTWKLQRGDHGSLAVCLCQNRRARSGNMSHILFRTWSCTNKNCSTAHHPTHRNYEFDLQKEFLFVFLKEVKKDHPGLLNRQGRSCLYTKINTHSLCSRW